MEPQFQHSQPRAIELINKLGPDGKEKIRWMNFQNTNNDIYKHILTSYRFRDSVVWRDYNEDYMTRYKVLRSRF